MTGSVRLITVACFVFVAANAASAQRGDSVVVLKNGAVFEGRISKLDHRVQIKLKDGGQITIAAEKVDFVSASLRSAYEFQVSRVAKHDVKARIQLARWCLDQQLVNAAADQLLIAQRINPENPAVVAFEHELVSNLRNAGRKTALAPKKPTGEPTSVDTSIPVREEVLASFTTTIQPLLWNRCGASACHGQRGTSSFRLTVPVRGTVPSREITHRNLQMTLQHISPENPRGSPLLLSARVPHGNLNRKRADLDLDQYEQLLNWTIAATRDFARNNVVTKSPNANLRWASFAFPDQDKLDGRADPFDPATFNAQQGHDKSARQSPSTSDRPWWEIDP